MHVERADDDVAFLPQHVVVEVDVAGSFLVRRGLESNDTNVLGGENRIRAKSYHSDRTRTVNVGVYN